MAQTPDLEKKRLKFRSAHRGIKELDLIIGSFAEQYLDGFDSGQLVQFEALLDIPEPVIYSWIIGKTQPPEEQKTEVLDLLLSFKLPMARR